jgi:hypothetical protein
MSLARDARLAPNFTAHELGADLSGIPQSAIDNLYTVAAWRPNFFTWGGVICPPQRHATGS